MRLYWRMRLARLCGIKFLMKSEAHIEFNSLIRSINGGFLSSFSLRIPSAIQWNKTWVSTMQIAAAVRRLMRFVVCHVRAFSYSTSLLFVNVYIVSLFEACALCIQHN